MSDELGEIQQGGGEDRDGGQEQHGQQDRDVEEEVSRAHGEGCHSFCNYNLNSGNCKGTS